MKEHQHIRAHLQQPVSNEIATIKSRGSSTDNKEVKLFSGVAVLIVSEIEKVNRRRAG